MNPRLNRHPIRPHTSHIPRKSIRYSERNSTTLRKLQSEIIVHALPFVSLPIYIWIELDTGLAGWKKYQKSDDRADGRRNGGRVYVDCACIVLEKR